jgi:hypothetical protein
MLFDGAVTPSAGTAAVDPDLPGNGLTLREADAQRYQVRS